MEEAMYIHWKRVRILYSKKRVTSLTITKMPQTHTFSKGVKKMEALKVLGSKSITLTC